MTTRTGGNVVQTARVAVGANGKAVLALGFGASQAEAVGTAEASLGPPFDKTLADYKQGWKRYDDSLNKPRTREAQRASRRPSGTGSRTSTT